ncbi:MAG: class I adenylate-forming enzyme family protein [Pseudomonadota bacterium]
MAHSLRATVDAARAPVIDGIAYFDRLCDDVAAADAETHVLGEQLDALRLWQDPDPRGRPAPPPFDTFWPLSKRLDERAPARVLVLGGAGFVGELVAGHCPTSTVTTVLARDVLAPPLPVVHAHLGAVDRAANHDVCFAAPDQDLPFDPTAFDTLVNGSPELPVGWLAWVDHARAAGIRVLDLVDAAPSAAATPGGEHRILVADVALADMSAQRLAAHGGLEIDTAQVEVLYFGQRGWTLGEIATGAGRSLADVLAAAAALADAGVIALLPLTAAAARLHHYLESGETLFGPDECQPAVLWRRAAARYGDRPALALHDGTTLSYTELDRLIAGFVALLADLDVRAGDRISVYSGPCVELVALFWATMAIGVTFVAMPTQTTPAGAVALHRRLHLRMLFVDRDLAPDGLPDADDLEVETFHATTEESAELRRAVGQMPNGASTLGCGSARAAIVSMTSGTTGASKAVLVSGQAAVIMALTRSEACGWCADDRVLADQYPTQMGAIRYGLLKPVCVGACHVLSVAPAVGHAFRVWELAERHAATVLKLSPVTAGQIATAIEERRLTPSAPLRLVENGGTHFGLPQRQYVVDQFGVPSYHPYGSTEANSATGTVLHGDGRLQAVTFRNVVMQVRAPDGRLLPDGEAGRLWTLRDDVLDGYWTAAGVDRSALDGFWLPLGDIVCRVAGRIDVLGRVDELFSTATGQLIVPTTIEDVIDGDPAVEASAVVPEADPRGAVQIVAFVQPSGQLHDPQALIDRLRAAVRAELGEGFVPRIIRFRHELPRNARGKLLRRALTNDTASLG